MNVSQFKMCNKCVSNFYQLKTLQISKMLFSGVSDFEGAFSGFSFLKSGLCRLPNFLATFPSGCPCTESRE